MIVLEVYFTIEHERNPSPPTVEAFSRHDFQISSSYTSHRTVSLCMTNEHTGLCAKLRNSPKSDQSAVNLDIFARILFPRITLKDIFVALNIRV